MNELTIKQLDQVIKGRFQVSLMSDTKWEKLIDCVTDHLGEVFLNYKLIHSSEVRSTSFYSPDCKPYFIEPILYREVEWVEFPVEYENYISSDNLKAGKKHYAQDIVLIEKVLSKIGAFELLRNNEGIKIYAYK